MTNVEPNYTSTSKNSPSLCDGIKVYNKLIQNYFIICHFKVKVIKVNNDLMVNHCHLVLLNY